MKKLPPFVLFLLTAMIISAQQVPNGNFENWTAASSYDDPTGWDTPNSTSATLGVVTVSQETSIVQNGSFSAKLKSGSIFGTPIPGLVTLGEFNINIMTFEATIEGGTPFTYKPEALTGYYQYEPVLGDEAFIGVILLKDNGGTWDTIADGNFTSTSTLLNWTPFTATITYHSTETPTHLNIIIMSSDRNAPQPNSTLYVDNLSFTYPASVNENLYDETDIFLADGMMNIVCNTSNSSILSVQLFSVEGRKLFETTFHDQPQNYASFPLEFNYSGIIMTNVIFTNGQSLSRKIYVEN